MNTIDVLNNLLRDHQVIAYLFIFLGLIFEGEIVVLTTGILSYIGALDFWVALSFILAGGIVKTFLGYYLGKYIHRKYNQSRFCKYIVRRVLYFMPRFNERPFWSIFISKFIMGMNYLIIIFSGYSKVNFRLFLKAEIISTFVWAPLLLSLGFLFSQTAFFLTEEISKFFFAIIGFFVVFLLFDKFLAFFYRVFWFVKNGIIEENNNDGQKS